MKLGDEKDTCYKLRVKRTRLGRLNAGTPFEYKGKLWIVVNRGDCGGKFIRTLVGDSHESCVKPSATIVNHIMKSNKQKF